MEGSDAIAIPAERSGRTATPTDAGTSERFELTENARGPWQPEAAHGGAPAALLARAAERHGAGQGMRLVSLQCTFFGPVMLGPIKIETEVVKPGRRQKVVATRLSAGDRTLVEARAILLRTTDLDLSEEARGAFTEETMPGREAGGQVERGRWASGGDRAFHRSSNTIVVVTGGPEEDRPDGAAWFRLDSPMVPGEKATPAQRAVAAADFGNGLAHPIPFGEYVFVNCDLNVWLLREPVGEWIGVKSRTGVSVFGSGLTTSTLFDGDGRVGAGGQALYVDRAG